MMFLESYIFELDFSRYEYLIIILAPLAAGLYKYAQKKGYKYVTPARVKEYRELKEFAGFLMQNISPEEMKEIVRKAGELKNKQNRSKEDVYRFGLFVLECFMTEKRE